MFTGEPWDWFGACGKVYCYELQHGRLVSALAFVLVQPQCSNIFWPVSGLLQWPVCCDWWHCWQCGIQSC